MTSRITAASRLFTPCCDLKVFLSVADSFINHDCHCVCVLQLLAEEKAISEKNAMERDNAERDARQNETKVGFFA